MKTRIAPTPSGFLHLGNVFSFLLTARIAEQAGAAILLRIDDIDRDRVRLEYVADVFDTLRFMGITWDEGPRSAADFTGNWSQLQRLDRYADALARLARTGMVFACDCSRADLQRHARTSGCAKDCRTRGLPLGQEGVNWRLHTDLSEALTVHAWNGADIVDTLPETMNEFIVRKKDGLPAYQLASLVDDALFGVDLVVRGQDLWPSTLAQLFLAKRLGMEVFLQTRFVHHPLLVGADGRKLSKSAGDTSLRALRAQGLTREQITRLITNLAS